MSQDRESPADGLATLFAAYREACPDPEPGADFMPQLWQKIEAKRAFSNSLKRLARAVIGLAAAASLAMAILLAMPQQTATPSYLEVLAASQSPHDSMADTEIVQAVYESQR
jgi:anti-sigma-K factor RskA